MGSMSNQLLYMFFGAMTVEAVDSLLQTARSLASLAQVAVDEEMDEVNANQLVEGALRCMDAIDMIVLGVSNENPEAEERYEVSGLKNSTDEMRATLDRIRSSIMEVTED